MIYSFSYLTLEEFIGDYSGIILPKDYIVLSNGMLPCLNLANLNSKHAAKLEELTKLSGLKQCVIFANTKCVYEMGKVNSVLVFDNGRMSGTVFEVMGKPPVCNTQVMVETSQGLVPIFIGGDIFYPELWRTAMLLRPRLALYFGSYRYNKKSFRMAQALGIACGCNMVSNYLDQTLITTPSGNLSGIETGKLRMIRPATISRTPYILTKSVRVTLEKLDD